MLFSDAVEPYLTYCRAEKLNTAETIAKYKACFRLWLLPHLGQKNLDELNRMDVLALRREIVGRNIVMQIFINDSSELSLIDAKIIFGGCLNVLMAGELLDEGNIRSGMPTPDA
jgi:hypothetical protein